MPEVSHFQVAMYVPNLIGYSRFIFLAICPYWLLNEDDWFLGFFCYGMSYFLDVFDGKAARAFNQTSRFGAALDQVCDRASNAVCYMILSVCYPSVSFLFFLCFFLDFGSHWL